MVSREESGRGSNPASVPSRVGKADAVRVSGRGATPSRLAITEAASTNKQHAWGLAVQPSTSRSGATGGDAVRLSVSAV